MSEISPFNDQDFRRTVYKDDVSKSTAKRRYISIVVQIIFLNILILLKASFKPLLNLIKVSLIGFTLIFGWSLVFLRCLFGLFEILDEIFKEMKSLSVATVSSAPAVIITPAPSAITTTVAPTTITTVNSSRRPNKNQRKRQKRKQLAQIQTIQGSTDAQEQITDIEDPTLNLAVTAQPTNKLIQIFTKIIEVISNDISSDKSLIETPSQILIMIVGTYLNLDFLKDIIEMALIFFTPFKIPQFGIFGITFLAFFTQISFYSEFRGGAILFFLILFIVSTLCIDTFNLVQVNFANSSYILEPNKIQELSILDLKFELLSIMALTVPYFLAFFYKILRKMPPRKNITRMGLIIGCSILTIFYLTLNISTPALLIHSLIPNSTNSPLSKRILKYSSEKIAFIPLIFKYSFISLISPGMFANIKLYDKNPPITSIPPSSGKIWIFQRIKNFFTENIGHDLIYIILGIILFGFQNSIEWNIFNVTFIIMIAFLINYDVFIKNTFVFMKNSIFNRKTLKRVSVLVSVFLLIALPFIIILVRKLYYLFPVFLEMNTNTSGTINLTYLFKPEQQITLTPLTLNEEYINGTCPVFTTPFQNIH